MTKIDRLWCLDCGEEFSLLNWAKPNEALRDHKEVCAKTRAARLKRMGSN